MLGLLAQHAHARSNGMRLTLISVGGKRILDLCDLGAHERWKRRTLISISVTTTAAMLAP
jgi:hypothetical protein